MTLPLSFGFGSCHKVRMDQWSQKKSWMSDRCNNSVGKWWFTGKGSKNTKYSWHSMQCMLIWGIWNFKIRYIVNVISCGFATPRDSAEIDILLKALLVPVWTVTCSYIIFCMQQLHQYASLSSKVSDTADTRVCLSQLSMALVKLWTQNSYPQYGYNMVKWLKWFSQKNIWIDEIFHDSHDSLAGL